MSAKTARSRRGLKSFYSQALLTAERSDLTVAAEVEGLDQEIAVLRLRLRQVLAERPDDWQLMFKGIDLLAKAVATRYRLSRKSERDLARSLTEALEAEGVRGIWQSEAGDD